MIEPPASLAWMAGDPSASAWLANAPAAFAAMLDQWDLHLDGPAYEGGSVSIVAPVLQRSSGSTAVLKLQWPHRESTHEAAALKVWNGDGAVRLLAHEPESNALLIERCEPGEALATRPRQEIVDVLVDLARTLGREPCDGTPFDTQASELASWAQQIDDARPRLERLHGVDLIDRVPAMVAALAAPVGPQVLANQDLHPGNVRSAVREPWLVIDPKPVLADREFGAVSIVRSTLLGSDRPAMAARLDLVADRLRLDRDRLRDIALLQMLAWGAGGANAERHAAAAATLASL